MPPVVPTLPISTGRVPKSAASGRAESRMSAAVFGTRIERRKDSQSADAAEYADHEPAGIMPQQMTCGLVALSFQK
jgi:hypothetical protein